MINADFDPSKLLAKYEQGTEKKVKSHDDIALWYSSQAYHDIIGYINSTSTAIQGVKNTDETFHVSNTIKKLCNIIEILDKLIDSNPPQEQPQRFGNRAYRNWSRCIYRDIYLLLEQAVPQSKCHYLNELGQYLSQSFGNSTRIDYGTGHELSFIFFLCALFKAEILKEDDIIAAALLLFNAYLIFVRRLQQVYNMEPAGSQGVWSLDDYQFVPFIWGSAQLCIDAPFEPSKFLDQAIINEYKDQYMFIGCIDYISKVKTGHFGEHSNQLWSITAVPTWPKINSGLVKMYQKEILCKFPVMQHAYFGELMSFDSVPPGTPMINARLGFKPTDRRGDSIFKPPAPPNSVVEQHSIPVLSVRSSDAESKATSSSSTGNSILVRPRMGSEETFSPDEKAQVVYPLPKSGSDESIKTFLSKKTIDTELSQNSSKIFTQTILLEKTVKVTEDVVILKQEDSEQSSSS